MKCEEVQERTIDLLYGTPEGGHRVDPELEEHIRACATCSRGLEGLKAVRGVLRSWKDEPPLRPVRIPSVASAKRGIRFSPWWLARYAAIAAMLILALLALANAQITWNSQGFSFKTHLLGSAAAPSEYYTKAEVRRILDDSEGRMMETNYLMLQRMMDTLEEERSSDLRFLRTQTGREKGRN